MTVAELRAVLAAHGPQHYRIAEVGRVQKDFIDSGVDGGGGC